IGIEGGILLHVVLDDLMHFPLMSGRDREGPRLARASDESDNGGLLRLDATAAHIVRAVLLLTTDIRLVNLDLAAHLAVEVPGLHGMANAMGHEPSGLVGDPKHSVKLMGTHALLAGRHQVDSHEPLVKRDMRTLKDRPDGHGKLTLARAAPEQALTSRGLRALLRRHAVNVLGI